MIDETKIHPILKSIKNSDLLDLASKPKLLCEEFNIPMVFVEGVKAKKVGRLAEFEYDGKSYKRVELVAKAYYEKQGLEVSWSEGAAVVLANVAINSAIARRLIGSFKVVEKSQFIGGEAKAGLDLRSQELKHQIYDEQLTEYEKLSFGTYKLIRHCIASASRDKKIQGEFADYEVNQAGQASSMVEHEVVPFLRAVDAMETIAAKASTIQESLSQSLAQEELLFHMSEFMEHEKRRIERNRTKVYSNYNEWSAAFGMRMIELLGPDCFCHRFGGAHVNKFDLMSSFDLTVLDTKRKVLKFAEVKNTDGLTPFQLLYLEEWIGLPREARPEFEFCFVQPQ